MPDTIARKYLVLWQSLISVSPLLQFCLAMGERDSSSRNRGAAPQPSLSMGSPVPRSCMLGWWTLVIQGYLCASPS